ncbi:M67 family metallopeptidase [Salinirubellus salinus]|uniref:M67 family metallopeptidase n=1 Tax=Salinirubellus salinus TaxID=1364945 RepID=A0A9E7UAA6_9EURY|nr:desampylase [Salinirubellus salinus]UWM53807.1 M67 family metallopeptidase [Salinirubellus salinus]
MTTDLVFERSAWEAVVTHAREGAPEEVCGVLAGTREGDRGRVTETRRVPNVAATPESRYELDPAEQVRAMDALEDAGHEVLGFYHSHPRGPARPSGVDEAQATWVGYAYCIVSLADAEPTVGSWRWTGEEEGFVAETVRVQSA